MVLIFSTFQHPSRLRGDTRLLTKALSAAFLSQRINRSGQVSVSRVSPARHRIMKNAEEKQNCYLRTKMQEAATRTGSNPDMECTIYAVAHKVVPGKAEKTFIPFCCIFAPLSG